jgi:hypothetical protein
MDLRETQKPSKGFKAYMAYIAYIYIQLLAFFQDDCLIVVLSDHVF